MEIVNILDKIRQKVKKIPTLPDIAFRLVRLLEDEKHSVNDIVNVINADAALTSRILNVANSAAFSRGKQISTLNRAITHLGENMVVGIAIGSCASSLLRKPLPGYIAEVGELWDHSLFTAIASKHLCQYAKTTIHWEQAYTAGLLHDLGKIVFSDIAAGFTSKVIDYCRENQNMDYLDGERAVMGADHSEAGLVIAQQWNLPPPLPDAIAYHHRPSAYQGEFTNVVFVVHLADIASMMYGAGTGADAMTYKMDAEFVQHLQLDKEDFIKLMLQVQDEFQAIKDSLFSA